MFNKGDIVVCIRDIMLTDGQKLKKNSLHICFSRASVVAGDWYCTITAPEPVCFRHFLACDFKKLEVGDIVKHNRRQDIWEVRKYTCFGVVLDKIGSTKFWSISLDMLCSDFIYCGAVAAPVKQTMTELVADIIALSNRKELKFKIGQKVICKSPYFSEYGIERNYIYEVKACDGDNIQLINSFPSDTWHCANYFKLVNPKFKAGDIVRIVKGDRYNEVVSIRSYDVIAELYAVNEIPGFEAVEEYFELFKEPKFKVGDVVKCIVDNILELPMELCANGVRKNYTFQINDNNFNIFKRSEWCFELVSRVIDGVTYTKEELEKCKCVACTIFNHDRLAKDCVNNITTEAIRKWSVEQDALDLKLKDFTETITKGYVETLYDIFDNVKKAETATEAYLKAALNIDKCKCTLNEAFGISPILRFISSTGRLNSKNKTNTHKSEEKEMNKIIAEMYPKTKDALLVDKWFGKKFELQEGRFTFTEEHAWMRVMLKGKEEDLLNAAKELEGETKNYIGLGK